MAKPQRKKFFEVSMPLVNESYEAIAYSIDELKGKAVKMDMTRKLKGKGMDLHFVIKIIDGKAVAVPKRLELLPFFIRYAMRGGISYVEDSFKTEAKDALVIIKPFLITRKKVSRAVQRTLRNSSKNWLVDYAKTKTSDELFEDILSGRLQKPLSQKLKKIYPLILCEIRVFQVKKSLEKMPEITENKEAKEKKE